MNEKTPNAKIIGFFSKPGDGINEKRLLLTEAKALSEADRAWFVAEIDRIEAQASKGASAA